MNLRPLHDGIVVKPDPPKRMVGLIHMPDSKRPRVLTGVVQRVGRGKLFVDGVYRPTQIQEGERVAFVAAATDTSQARAVARSIGDDLLLLSETDVLFVCEGDEIPEIY